MTLFSGARAAFYTSRGPFAHLWTTPLRWRARNVAVPMSEKCVTIVNCVKSSFYPNIVNLVKYSSFEHFTLY